MSQDESNIKTFNIITLGSSEVGKTCIIRRYIDNEYISSTISTIGIDCKAKIFTINSIKYKIIYYDTAGQERYASISSKYIKSANGVILVYDITNKKTFSKIEEWSNILERNNKNYSAVLVGNKMDLESERQVSTNEGLTLANKLNIEFFETSCLTNQNIEEMMNKISTLTINRFDSKRNSNLSLNKVKKKDGKNCC
jgi:small GTP-binding protein